MYSRLPSRNHRSKGIKVKHILQVCLLAALCFWLIYQVKHSHEKKKEFDEKDVKLASETQNGNEILRLGRKDISREETITDARLHGEDAQENEAGKEEKMYAEDAHENEADEEEKIHADGEKERLESKIEDTEEEENIDKSEEDKIDDEIQDELIVDEDKEIEEGDEANEVNDDSEKRDNEESDTMLEDPDQEREARNIHEAREEHYKADDASSEVAHDVKIVKHTNENPELFVDGKENFNRSSNQPILVKSSHDPTEGTNSSYSRVLDSKDNFTVPGSISSENSMILRELIDQSQTSNNLTQSESKQSDDMSQAQNATYGASNSDGSNKNKLDATTVSNFSQNVNNTSEGSLVSSGEIKLAIAENNYIAAETKADNATSLNAGTSKSPVKVSDNKTIAGEDESLIYDTTIDKANTDLDDPFDDSDSSLTQEEKEYPTDLGTLTDV